MSASRSRHTDKALAAEPIELTLRPHQPFDAAGLMQWMSARAIAGLEVATETSFARTLHLPGGPGWFEVRLDVGASSGSDAAILLRAHLTDSVDLDELILRVRRLFDLDVDPRVIDAALSRHPELAAALSRVPGIRVPGALDPHEMLIRAMIGQQVSVASARTALTRLTHALGRSIALPTGEQAYFFPSMEQIASRGHEVLRGPRARILALTQTAAALADGSLPLGFDDDGSEQRAALLARRGIGPWTADYVRMRVLGDPDVFLPGDVAVRNGARTMGIPNHPRELEKWAERVAPWRSYLTAHLWRATAPPSAPRNTIKPPLEQGYEAK